MSITFRTALAIACCAIPSVAAADPPRLGAEVSDEVRARIEDFFSSVDSSDTGDDGELQAAEEGSGDLNSIFPADIRTRPTPIFDTTDRAFYCSGRFELITEEPAASGQPESSDPEPDIEIEW